MNLPNIITLSRIPTMFIIVWLMYCDWRWAATIAFWLFITAAIGDWLDGYIARKQNLVSNFGKFMDALTDKVLIIGIMVAFVGIKIIPVPWVLITLCREFLVSGMRMVAASKGVVVAAERGGKLKTVMQIVAVSILLLVPMVQRDFAHYLAFDVDSFAVVMNHIGLWIFIIATALTVSSGISYALKYKKVFDETNG